MLNMVCIGFVLFVGILWRPPGVRRAVKKAKKRTQKVEKDNALQVLDVGIMLTEVATRLRGGASANDAWGKTLVRYRLFKQLPNIYYPTANSDKTMKKL